MVAVEGVPQSVLDHRVDEIEVAHLLAGAQIGRVGRLAHGFLAARHHDGAVAVADRLGAQRHGAQARAAHHVDRPGRRAVGHARVLRGLARRVLALRRRQDLAEDDFGDVFGLDARALERVLDRDLAQIVRRHVVKRAIEGAHWGTNPRYDDNVFHLFLPEFSACRSLARNCRECEHW